MSLFAAFTLMALGAAPQSGDVITAKETVTISLPVEASVGGLEIMVDDVATAVTGAADATLARVRGASLGYAPAPGYSRVLRADLVEASLQAALPGLVIEVTGAKRCRVSPLVMTVKGVEIQAEAASAVRKALSGLDANAQPEGVVTDLQFPGGDVEPRLVARFTPRSVQPGLVTVPVQVWFGDRLYRTISVSYRVSIWRRQAVLRRAVNVGEALNAGLFEVKRVPIEQARGLQALGIDEVAGSIALKPMRAGSAVLERDVHREVIIRKGDNATVEVSKGAVRVTDVGIVQIDGRMGERVRVQLRSTGRELIGVVRGPQLVEVKIQ